MTAWVTVPDGDIDPDSPITTPLMTALRDNVAASFEKASGAPVLANDYIVNAMVIDNTLLINKLRSTIGTNTTTAVVASGTWSPTEDGLYYVEAQPATATFEYQVLWDGSWTTITAFTDASGVIGPLWMIAGNTRIQNVGGLTRNLKYQRFLG